jgi:HRD ubiquitin ligase complex, ER membrane component
MDNTHRNELPPDPSADPSGAGGNAPTGANPEVTNDESSSTSNENTSRTSGSANNSSGNTNSAGDRSHRTELGIFERFMDNFLGRGRTTGASTEARETTTSSNGSRTGSGAEPINAAGDTGPTTTPFISTDSTDSTETADARAIIITVNYVFSDENNPQNPNRAGSLIMSLPNNSSNRDPLVIQEFIRLATHMAYTSIVNGLNKEKGITLKKFNSFPHAEKEELELGEHTNCSICFEGFDKKCESEEEERPRKRRKLEKTLSDESLSATQGDQDPQQICIDVPAVERNVSQTQEVESDNTEPQREVDPDLNETSQAAPLGNSQTPESTESSAQGERKLLADYTASFDHHAIKMPCGHIFGKDCLFYWLKQHTTCPLCRASVADPETAHSNANSSISMFDLPSNITNLNVNTNTIGSNNVNNASNDEQANENSNESSRTTTAFGSIPTRFHYFGLGGTNSTNTPLRRILRSGVGVPERISQPESSDNSNETNPFSHVYNYLRRQRPNNTQPEPLFPTGMSSRRTANGIETTSTDNNSNHSEILDFLNLRSLVDDDSPNRPDPETEQDDTNNDTNNDTNDN